MAYSVQAWLDAFMFTQAVEIPAYVLAIRHAQRTGHAERPRTLFWQIVLAFGASAITHPQVWFVIPRIPSSSYIEYVARADRFRHVFHGLPSIGGRYSALSDFGMAPAALIGLDVERLEITAEECGCLATHESGLRFWQRLAASAPGRLPRFLRVPWAGIWLLLWTAIVALLALAKGLVEGVGAVLVLLLRRFSAPERS